MRGKKSSIFIHEGKNPEKSVACVLDFRFSYTMMCSNLASHGYVVAAVEHRDGSACYSYTGSVDGGVVEHLPHLQVQPEDDEYAVRYDTWTLGLQRRVFKDYLRRHSDLRRHENRCLRRLSPRNRFSRRHRSECRRK